MQLLRMASSQLVMDQAVRSTFHGVPEAQMLWNCSLADPHTLCMHIELMSAADFFR